MLNIPKLFDQYGIKPKGVIHVGAHTGQEVKTYIEMGFGNILLIEANPEVYKRLVRCVSKYPNVITACYAVCDYDGRIYLKVTSNDESSSILSLKYHKELYPDIIEVKQVKVPCRKLDSLIEDLKLNPDDYNFLTIDVQGAELIALRGAGEVLRRMDAVIAELNFKELYEGCALAEDVDMFLKGFGFERKETVFPFDPSWGDALYVKENKELIK